VSHLNIGFDRYASIGTVMHYILVISFRILKQFSGTIFHLVIPSSKQAKNLGPKLSYRTITLQLLIVSGGQ